MKKLLLLLCSSIFLNSLQAQICNPSGNIVIYSNYDGGELNINIDQNIPNLKLGIVAYEAVRINISGAFVGNVTEVIFAGYPSTNSTHCSTTIPATSVNGVPAGIVNIYSYPPVTLSNPNGYNSIICAYSCDNNTNQGGCNTVDQIEDYFITQFSGTLYSHHTQYGCWLTTETYLVSAGGNCCPVASNPPVAEFTVTANSFSICAGDCIDFTDQSTNAPTSWAWSMPGASITSSTAQNPNGICYPNDGTFAISLVATNAAGSDNVSYNITVHPLPAIPTISQNLAQLQSSVAVSYQWSLNGTPIGGATGQTHTATINGNYTVTVTDANGCSNTSAPYSFNSVDVLNIEESDMVLIYPNPSSEYLQLKTAKLLLGSQVVLIDQNGKMVDSFVINSTLIQIDLTNYSIGNYTLIFTGTDKVYTKKIIIAN